MRRPRLSLIALLLTLASQGAAIADAGDPGGWSVDIDPRGRAFLKWVPEQGGPRNLVLGCLRDVGTFSTMSDAVGEHDEIDHVKLTLSNGPARFEVDGSITLDQIAGRSTFTSDLDVDEQQLRTIEGTLLPVLEGRADITITMAPGTPAGSARTLQIPNAGMAASLGRFRDICFR
jgi:hypothetical protein